MNDLSLIAFGSGMQDGLNPCIFMSCAVFIVHRFWVAPHSRRGDLLSIAFVVAYGLSLFEFNFGAAQFFTFRKEFIFAAKIVYLILGAGTFILGVVFFKDWFLMRVTKSVRCQGLRKIKPFASDSLAVGLTTVLLSVVSSVLATLAPMNKYMMLLGNEALMRGQWQEIVTLLAGYIFFSMWPLWFVWVFLSIKNLSPSLSKIVCAAIFFTASSCMILIFK